MRITSLLLARKNLIEAYHDRSIVYSILFPSLFLSLIMVLQPVDNYATINLAFVFGALYDALLALPGEMEKGTLVKILLSPVSQWSIIGGRMISSFVLNIIKTTLTFIILVTLHNELLTGIAFFYAASSLITLLTVTIGLLCSAISSIFKANPNATRLLATSAILLLALTPIFNQGSQGTSPSVVAYYRPFVSSYKIIESITSPPIQMFPADMLWIFLFFMIASICLRRRIE